MIRRPTGLLSDHVLETYLFEIKRVHDRIDHVDCIVLSHPIVQAFWKECPLGTIGAFYETFDQHPPSSHDGEL